MMGNRIITCFIGSEKLTFVIFLQIVNSRVNYVIWISQVLLLSDF